MLEATAREQARRVALSVAGELVKYALSEDVGTGDITTLNALPSGVRARAVIVARAPGMVAGIDVARLALWDMYLVKDTHIRAAGGVTAAIERILRTRQGDLLLEIEVESLDQLREALRPEVDRVLVDNRPVEEVRRAVQEVDLWSQAH